MDVTLTKEEVEKLFCINGFNTLHRLYHGKCLILYKNEVEKLFCIKLQHHYLVLLRAK